MQVFNLVTLLNEKNEQALKFDHTKEDVKN